MKEHPTRFENLHDLARLPWFGVREGRLVVTDPEVPEAIDLHTHLALAFLRPLQLDLNRVLVQRYIESARGAVFFLDPHVCLKCHYRSTELLWQCPHCHEWNSFVEERIAAARQTSSEM